MSVPTGGRLFPDVSTTRTVVDRLTARALNAGLASAGEDSEVLAADELLSISGGDDLALVLALQRIRRGMYARPDSVVLDRAARTLHLALARRQSRSDSPPSDPGAVTRSAGRAWAPISTDDGSSSRVL